MNDEDRCFPEIITLCGSTRFADAYIAETRRLTLEGTIVISVGLFGHQEGLAMDGPVKSMLDELHLRKIDLADRVHVINPKTIVCCECGKACNRLDERDTFGAMLSDCCSADYRERSYIGESTRREIAYATVNGKTITYLETPQ